MWCLIDHCMYAQCSSIHGNNGPVVDHQLLNATISVEMSHFLFASETCWFVEKSLSFRKFLYFFPSCRLCDLCDPSHAATCSVLNICLFFFYYQVSNNEFKNEMTDKSDWFDESSNEGTAWPMSNQIFDNNVLFSQLICLFGVRCTVYTQQPALNFQFAFLFIVNQHSSLFYFQITHSAFVVFECFVFSCNWLLQKPHLNDQSNAFQWLVYYLH